MKKIGALLLALALCVSLAGCGNGHTEQPAHTRTSVALDTTVSVSVYDGEESLLDKSIRRIGELEGLFSAHLPDSDIARLNAAGGAETAIHAETAALLKKAVRWAADTRGVFDPTVKPLLDLWDFSAEDPRVPSKAEIDKAKMQISWHMISVSETSARLDKGATVDLGGIAKGYIADLIAKDLRSENCTSALINLGGDVLAVGSKDGADFRVGIRDPQNENGVVTTVLVQDKAVVTSGVYERGFDLNGVRYHHILDPSTGYPANSGLLSVTVICGSAADGDALATACMVLGEEGARSLLAGQPDTEAVFVRNDGTVSMTDGVKVA